MRIVIEVWAKDGSPHGKKGENKGSFLLLKKSFLQIL